MEYCLNSGFYPKCGLPFGEGEACRSFTPLGTSDRPNDSGDGDRKEIAFNATGS